GGVREVGRGAGVSLWERPSDRAGGAGGWSGLQLADRGGVLSGGAADRGPLPCVGQTPRAGPALPGRRRGGSRGRRGGGVGVGCGREGEAAGGWGWGGEGGDPGPAHAKPGSGGVPGGDARLLRPERGADAVWDVSCGGVSDRERGDGGDVQAGGASAAGPIGD